MENTDIKKLVAFPLFASLGEDELNAFLNASSSFRRAYPKGGVIIAEGENTGNMGVLIEGRCTGESLSEDGRRESVAHIAPGDIFGDILAMDPKAKSPVTVRADAACAVLFIPFSSILGGSCSVSARLLANLLGIVSQKYFALHFRASCISRPTLRGKIAAYLHGMCIETGSRRFVIPFSRAELADFLACDRSALCRELSRMKSDGIIDFEKNRFDISDLNYGEVL